MRFSRPRSAHKITKRNGVSKTTVFHLREGVKSGQAQTSGSRLFLNIKSSDGNLKSLRGSMNVHQKSQAPIPIGKGTRFCQTNNVTALGGTSCTGFLPKIHDTPKKLISTQGSQSLTSSEETNLRNHVIRSKVNDSAMSKLNVPSARVSSSHREFSRFSQSDQLSNSKSKPFLNVERLHLFQALSKEPLTFLSAHERFNVSRQTMTRLVKREFLAEAWGSTGVGVTFKLTSKGNAYLSELEEASKYEPRIRECRITRLKQRSFA